MTKNEYIVNKICNIVALTIFIILALLPFSVHMVILCVLDAIVYLISITNIIDYESKGDIYEEA